MMPTGYPKPKDHSKSKMLFNGQLNNLALSYNNEIVTDFILSKKNGKIIGENGDLKILKLIKIDSK